MSGGLKDRGANPQGVGLDGAFQENLLEHASLHAGHRSRLKQRFMSCSQDVLPDYELLELLLFSAVPRRDTKPMAKLLLQRFGSFAEVINAPAERLKEVKGVGDSAVLQLRLVRAGALRLMKGGIMHQPVLSSWNAVIEYCRAAMGFETREQFRILFLERRAP